MNGERHWQSIKGYSREEVSAWLDVLRTSSGKEFQTQLKTEYTETPTVQGMWNSYTNADPHTATAKFPDVDLSKPAFMEKSATELLLDLQSRQRAGGSREEPRLNEDVQRQLEREKQ